jgi:hypothetical protein
MVDSKCTYEDTLKRHGTAGLALDEERVRRQWHGVIFEPEAYIHVVGRLLTETGNCQLLVNAAFDECTLEGNSITGLTVRLGDREKVRVEASYFIDCTNRVYLGQAAGCETAMGREASGDLGEPSAPETGDPQGINAITLVYRVTPSKTAGIETIPRGVSETCWFAPRWPGASIGKYPCADLNINMLPTMEGAEFLGYLRMGSTGYREAYEECRKRVLGHWHFLQLEYPEFRHYRLGWLAPSLGVREGLRVRGRYILTEKDVRGGLSSQPHVDIVALADHALDIHGKENTGCVELSQPYGVPYRCLTVDTVDNLLVAGMGASFSHIAASSCRLSRTMMDLGHAAGAATALAFEDGSDVQSIDVSQLRERLVMDGATLVFGDQKDSSLMKP